MEKRELGCNSARTVKTRVLPPIRDEKYQFGIYGANLAELRHLAAEQIGILAPLSSRATGQSSNNLYRSKIYTSKLVEQRSGK